MQRHGIKSVNKEDMRVTLENHGLPLDFLTGETVVAPDRTEEVRLLLEQLRQNMKDAPDDANALNDTAWILATTPVESLRNGREAVKLAERAVKLTRGEEASMLDTLGVAHAATGAYRRAAEYAQQALDIQRELGNPRGMILTTDTLGDVRYLRGDYAGARTVYRECLERVVNNHLPEENKAMPFSKLGFTATAVGDFTEARTCFRTALALAAAARVS